MRGRAAAAHTVGARSSTVQSQLPWGWAPQLALSHTQAACVQPLESQQWQPQAGCAGPEPHPSRLRTASGEPTMAAVGPVLITGSEASRASASRCCSASRWCSSFRRTCCMPRWWACEGASDAKPTLGPRRARKDSPGES